MVADERLRQISRCLGELERIREWHLEHPGNNDLGAVIGECDWRDELQHWLESESVEGEGQEQ